MACARATGDVVERLLGSLEREFVRDQGIEPEFAAPHIVAQARNVTLRMGTAVDTSRESFLLK